jgi:SAM-dependent methyltransferase
VLNLTPVRNASGGNKLMRSGWAFEDSAFDATVFGVMVFPEKQTAFREALRVLKPGGRFLFEVWDRRDEIVIQHTGSRIEHPWKPPGRLLMHDPALWLRK